MRRRLVSLAAVLLISACGGSSPTSPGDTRILLIEGSLAFGDVVAGDVVTASLTLRNGGTAPLTVTGLSGPAGLTVDWTNGTIAPSATQVVTFTFAPTTAGTLAGTVTLAANQTAGATTVPVSAAVFPRLVGGWAGTLTFAVSGDSNTCTHTWIVQTQAGGAFGGTWQLSGGTTVACGSAGTLTGQVGVTGALSGVTLGVTVGGLPSECVRIAGDAAFEGTVTGASLAAQNTETIRCDDVEFQRAVSMALTRQ